MTQQISLSHEFVEFIPDDLKQGTIYVSIRFATAMHLCCCGCGEKVVTPLRPTDWKLTFDGKTISLDPSIGNWSFTCRSHYWIRNNRVQWADQWSQEAIDAGRTRDRRAKERYFAGNNLPEPAQKAEPQILNQDGKTGKFVFGPNHPTPGQALPLSFFFNKLGNAVRVIRVWEDRSSQVEMEFIQFCSDLVAQSDDKIIKAQVLPDVLDALHAAKDDVVFRALETVSATARLSFGIEAWRRAPRELQARMKWDVAESSRAVTAGFIESPRSVNSVEKFADLVALVKRIIDRVPVSLWEAETFQQRRRGVDFSWAKFLRDNLEWAFRQTANTFVAEEAVLVPGKGIDVVDDALKELAGVMALLSIKLPFFQNLAYVD
jgi:hypothetical protein